MVLKAGLRIQIRSTGTLYTWIRIRIKVKVQEL
jgi:hypothetical protein